MIEDLDKTITQLLVNELPVTNGDIGIEFHQPTREWSARRTKPVINLFLYDVRENNTLRQHQWQPTGNERNGRVAQKRTPYRVDCHYMLTCWANEPEDEHFLLSRAMLALFRHPILPETYLFGQMKEQPFDVQAHLARHDRLTNPAEVWSVLDNEMRPAVAYIVTLALDPWTEIDTQVVHTFTLRTGQANALPDLRALTVDAGAGGELHTIGGRVNRGQTPQADIRVAIQGTGHVAASDAEGRFVLGMFPAGDYTLVAWPEKGRPTTRDIAVPSREYDIELKS